RRSRRGASRRQDLLRRGDGTAPGAPERRSDAGRRADARRDHSRARRPNERRRRGAGDGVSTVIKRCAWLVALVAAAATVAGCGSGGSGRSLVVYNGQHLELTRALVSAFQRKTGVQVKLRSNDAVVLADQILQEGSSSPADVYLSENSPELVELAEHKLLA